MVVHPQLDIIGGFSIWWRVKNQNIGIKFYETFHILSSSTTLHVNGKRVNIHEVVRYAKTKSGIIYQ